MHIHSGCVENVYTIVYREAELERRQVLKGSNYGVNTALSMMDGDRLRHPDTAVNLGMRHGGHLSSI